MNKSVLEWFMQTVVLAVFCVAASSAVAQNASIDEQFANQLKLVEGLKVYNDQLADQLQAQQKAQTDIQRSIAQAAELGPQIVPVLNKMLSSLEAFIRADLPFHQNDRLESVAQLKGLMLNSEASNSDRYRNILDIYGVEMEYGNSYEAYAETQVVGGNQVEVDMLRVGRLALFYQTKDQKESFMWDKVNGEWKQLPESDNRNIRKAIKVANKSIAPEMLTLPIAAPEAS